MSKDQPLDRRGFLKVVGVAGAAIAPGTAAVAQTAPMAHDHSMPAPTPATGDRLAGWQFFNADEADFVKAALDTLIPADPTGPGAVEAGCATYMDRALAGAHGRGARLYLQGPFAEGTPQQGYQLPLTPADLVRVGIADIDAHALSSRQKHFKDLAPADRAALLTEVETNKAQLANVPAGTWFAQFLNLTMEGYFGDPIYGGNRDKAVWKMIGYPGVAGMYTDAIDEFRNKPFTGQPQSIQDFS